MRTNNKPRPHKPYPAHHAVNPNAQSTQNMNIHPPPKAPPVHTALTHPQFISALEPRPRAFAPPEPAPVNVPRHGDRSLRPELGHALDQTFNWSVPLSGLRLHFARNRRRKDFAADWTGLQLYCTGLNMQMQDTPADWATKLDSTHTVLNVYNGVFWR
jgi:hypothetical protein